MLLLVHINLVFENEEKTLINFLTNNTTIMVKNDSPFFTRNIKVFFVKRNKGISLKEFQFSAPKSHFASLEKEFNVKLCVIVTML